MLAGDHFRTASQRLENGFVGPPPKHYRRRSQRESAARYEKQATTARTRSGPKPPENSSKSIPAPRTRAVILSAIMFEIPSSNGERLWPARFRVTSHAGRMVSHEAGDTSPPIGPGRGRQTRPQKSYAVGLEMLCPGGAYAWAPKIPSADTLAGSMPSKCELVHYHAHSFQNGAGLSVPRPRHYLKM